MIHAYVHCKILKKANSNQFLELNNILLFLTSMCVKIYYFNTKRMIKKTSAFNQSILVELLSFKVNNQY